MPVLSLGISYRRATVDLLERLAFGEEDLPKAYHHLFGLGSVSEAVILSTCNRIEVYAEVARYHQGFQDLKRFLAEARDVAVEDFAEPLYSHYEDHAAEHLFSVAAGIDSMVVGEPQILSQVREAFKRADREEAVGPALAGLFRHAIRVGRRARGETEIGASPGAFVHAGAGLAEEHLGGLEGRSLLVVGAGKMGSLAIRALRDRGVSSVRVLNRSPERAARLAARAGAGHGSLGEMQAALAEADLVVSSTGATGTVIGVEEVTAAVHGRERPLFLLDLAVPRDVDPSARELPSVRVADIDDLRGVVDAGREGEDDELDRVRAIVAEETARYAGRRREAKLAPLIAALHERGEVVRAEELERLAGRLAGLSDREREALDALTRGIVKTLLHDPVVRLKELSARGAADAHARALAELFGLDVGE
jgi:glutamyl-tRNA reductase